MEEQLVQIILNIYLRLHQLDASSALQDTKDKIDKLLLSKKIDSKIAEHLGNISDKCFDFWSPLCEMDIDTYKDIQNNILPQIRQLLSIEYLSTIDNEIRNKKLTVYDFNKLDDLPDPKFDNGMVKVDDLDYDDNQEDYTYEDGSYCSACQQKPCMCSDPERTSTVWNG